jgi:hypothetical protein
MGANCAEDGNPERPATDNGRRTTVGCAGFFTFRVDESRFRDINAERQASPEVPPELDGSSVNIFPFWNYFDKFILMFP